MDIIRYDEFFQGQHFGIVYFDYQSGDRKGAPLDDDTVQGDSRV